MGYRVSPGACLGNHEGWALNSLAFSSHSENEADVLMGSKHLEAKGRLIRRHVFRAFHSCGLVII